MKKYLLIIAGLCTFITGIGSASAYQQQGFNQYNEDERGRISFRCQTTCAILLGDKSEVDVISVSGGTHEGTGLRGYGYIFAQTVYPGGALLSADTTQDTYSRSITEDLSYIQLPEQDVPLVFVVSGPLLVSGMTLQTYQRTRTESLIQIWKNFRETEQLAPYSINLHYGPMVGSWSFPFTGFIVVLLSVIIASMVRRKFSLKHMCNTAIITLIVVMIVGGVRGLADDIRITHTGLNNFSRAADDQKAIFDLGSYITVTDKIRQHLQLDNTDAWKDKECNIYAKADLERPFVVHRGSVYLRPCTVVQTGSLSDYQLYYNVTPDGEATGSIVLSGSDFVLFSSQK